MPSLAVVVDTIGPDPSAASIDTALSGLPLLSVTVPVIVATAMLIVALGSREPAPTVSVAPVGLPGTWAS